MSRKVADAADRVIATCGLLEVETSEGHHRLGSALLRRWAPLLHCTLCLNEDGFDIPDLLSFMEAGRNIERLHLMLNSRHAAEQAASVLPSCPAACSVTCGGTNKPRSFPPQMTGLTTDSEVDLDIGGLNWGTQMPSILMYHLQDHKRLKMLELEFSSAIFTVSLDCSARLPALEQICIGFCISDQTKVSLDWLYWQPYKCLTLDIEVFSAKARRHKKISDQLQQLRVHRLTLRCYVVLPAAIQALWQCLTVSPIFTLL